MAERCETRDTLVSNSGAVKVCLAGPRQSQMFAVPCHLFAKGQGTLIEQCLL